MNTKQEDEIDLINIKKNNIAIRYAFFGTGPLAESAIYNLYQSGLIPAAIITKPDATIGRDHIVTAPIIKIWAQSKGVKVYQPNTLKKETLEVSTDINDIDFYKYVKENDIDIAIVASFGKIIPEHILNWPSKGILNIHPSMLPLYRGPSPIESQLLDGCDSIGLSIMKLDVGMDSGPLYIQKELDLNLFAGTAINHFSSSSDTFANMDYNSETIERLCGREGANMILQILPFIIEGTLKAKDQDHSKATFCKFIEKSQGDVTDLLKDSITEILTLNEINNKDKNEASLVNKGISSKLANQILNKWRALNPWPGLYFFINHNDKSLRVKINKINIDNTKNFIFLKKEVKEVMELSDIFLEVTPEGKRPMTWQSFVNGYISQPHPRLR